MRPARSRWSRSRGGSGRACGDRSGRSGARSRAAHGPSRRCGARPSRDRRPRAACPARSAPARARSGARAARRGARAARSRRRGRGSPAPSPAACSRSTCSVAWRKASSVSICSGTGVAPASTGVTCPNDSSARVSQLPIASSRSIASRNGTASRWATDVGIARSTKGTPSRCATAGPTWLPPAPYGAESVIRVMRRHHSTVDALPRRSNVRESGLWPVLPDVRHLPRRRDPARQPDPVARRAAEQRGVELGALEQPVHVGLPREADAAVRLDRRAGHLDAGVARRRAGQAARLGAAARAPRPPPRRRSTPPSARPRSAAASRAQRWATAWNEPTGTPNCLRS